MTLFSDLTMFSYAKRSRKVAPVTVKVKPSFDKGGTTRENARPTERQLGAPDSQVPAVAQGKRPKTSPLDPESGTVSVHVWDQSRVRVHSIFAVCIMSSVTLFCVLIYDIIIDSINASVATSDKACLQAAFRMVNVYLQILKVFDADFYGNGTACCVPERISPLDTLWSLVAEVRSTCDDIPEDLRTLCRLILDNLMNVTSGDAKLAGFDSTAKSALGLNSMPPLKSLTMRLSEAVLLCFAESRHTRWTYPSLFNSFLTILWGTFERTLVCCYQSSSATTLTSSTDFLLQLNLSSYLSSLTTPRPSTSTTQSSSSSSSSPAAFNSLRNISMDRTLSFLILLLSESGFNSYHPDLWNVTQHLQSAVSLDDCGSASSSPYETFHVVFGYVLECLTALEEAILDSGEIDIGHYIRRVVFNCCAVLVGVATAVVVSVRVRNMADWIERYARTLEKKTEELDLEKEKTNRLLYQMLPPTIADQLKSQATVGAETFDSTSIYFSDIVGFTTIAAGSSPMQVVELLNNLYSTFDSRIDTYDVYKVETIGDAYMVASGVPNRNGVKHAEEIATMSIDLLSAVKQVQKPAHVESHLQVRIGLNSAMKIHISKATMELLYPTHNYVIEPRGEIEVKGKGKMETFWLLGRKDMGEANDSMVCMFRPKKKIPKKATGMSSVSSLSVVSEGSTALSTSSPSPGHNLNLYGGKEGQEGGSSHPDPNAKFADLHKRLQAIEEPGGTSDAAEQLWPGKTTDAAGQRWPGGTTHASGQLGPGRTTTKAGQLGPGGITDAAGQLRPRETTEATGQLGAADGVGLFGIERKTDATGKIPDGLEEEPLDRLNVLNTIIVGDRSESVVPRTSLTLTPPEAVQNVSGSGPRAGDSAVYEGFPLTINVEGASGESGSPVSGQPGPTCTINMEDLSKPE